MKFSDTIYQDEQQSFTDGYALKMLLKIGSKDDLDMLSAIITQWLHSCCVDATMDITHLPICKKINVTVEYLPKVAISVGFEINKPTKS